MTCTEYYTPVGSYDGAVKIGGRWVRAIGLNRIDKRGWRRRSGPPTPAIISAIRNQPAILATELFPRRPAF
jgi:hypothetical protein